MCRLRIELGFAFSAFDPGDLDRLGLFTRQLALPDELLLPSMGLELRPSVFLPVCNDIGRFLRTGVTKPGYQAEEQ